MNYYFHNIVGRPFEDVVVKISEALKKEGFGIITTIDLKKIFKEKLNVDYGIHVILGVCVILLLLIKRYLWIKI